MRERLTVWQARRCFADSAAYFALAESRDRHYAEAQTLIGLMSTDRWRLFTTNFVVAEAHALLLNRIGRQAADIFLQEIDRSRGTTVVRVTSEDERRARDIIARYDDKDFSLTDAISFAVMERLGIPFAFTFDAHFAQYGWTVLTEDHF